MQLTKQKLKEKAKELSSGIFLSDVLEFTAWEPFENFSEEEIALLIEQTAADIVLAFAKYIENSDLEDVVSTYESDPNDITLSNILRVLYDEADGISCVAHDIAIAVSTGDDSVRGILSRKGLL